MAAQTNNALAKAIENALISPNELDSNWEAANIVDVVGKLARAVWHISLTHEKESEKSSIELLAQAIAHQSNYHEVWLGANMEDVISNGLQSIASAIGSGLSEIAEAVRESKA